MARDREAERRGADRERRRGREQAVETAKGIRYGLHYEGGRILLIEIRLARIAR